MNHELGKAAQVLPFGRGILKIRAERHPDEIIDVSPEVVATMNARLRGTCLDEVFCRDDQITKEFLILKEVEKLRRVFRSASEVYEAFSSLASIRTIRKELEDESVEVDVLADFAFKSSGGCNIDEVDIYSSLLLGTAPITKDERFRMSPSSELLAALRASYLGSHFVSLRISREVIQTSPFLTFGLNAGTLVADFNSVLAGFYRLKR